MLHSCAAGQETRRANHATPLGLNERPKLRNYAPAENRFARPPGRCYYPLKGQYRRSGPATAAPGLSGPRAKRTICLNQSSHGSDL